MYILKKINRSKITEHVYPAPQSQTTPFLKLRLYIFKVEKENGHSGINKVSRDIWN